MHQQLSPLAPPDLGKLFARTLKHPAQVRYRPKLLVVGADQLVLMINCERTLVYECKCGGGLPADLITGEHTVVVVSAFPLLKSSLVSCLVPGESSPVRVLQN